MNFKYLMVLVSIFFVFQAKATDSTSSSAEETMGVEAKTEILTFEDFKTQLGEYLKEEIRNDRFLPLLGRLRGKLHFDCYSTPLNLGKKSARESASLSGIRRLKCSVSEDKKLFRASKYCESPEQEMLHLGFIYIKEGVKMAQEYSCTLPMVSDLGSLLKEITSP